MQGTRCKHSCGRSKMKSWFSAPTLWASVITNRGEGERSNHRNKIEGWTDIMAAKAKRTSRRAKVVSRKPIVIVTGAAGNLGQSLGNALRADYQVVGFDLRTENSDFPIIGTDLTSEPAVELAFRKFYDSFG